MKITVIGAGNIGEALVQRAAVDPLTTGIYWINRSHSHDARAEDIRQGLSLLPTCRFIETSTLQEESFGHAIANSDLTVVTAGTPLDAKETDRSKLYPVNCESFSSGEAPLCGLLKKYQPKFTLVVTNPVELITRFLHRHCELPPDRIVGLGTVVETARLRSEIASLTQMYCGLEIAYSEVWAYAIGTHDKKFVPVIPRVFSPVGTVSDAQHATICRCAAVLAARGPERIKRGNKPTSFTIVESIFAVLRAVVMDTRDSLTVSTLDSQDPDGLFYAVPTILGTGGVLSTTRQTLESVYLEALGPGKDAMREVLRRFPMVPGDEAAQLQGHGN